MIPSSATVRTALLTTGAVALLIACSALLDAGARSPKSSVEQRIIEPVQRVVSPVSNADLLPDLVDAACPAIVTIDLPPEKRGKPTRAGGIVVSSRGAILASAPGLRRGDTVEVAFNDGSIRPGQVTVVHGLSGMAIIQVEADGLIALGFDDADLPRVGSWGFTLSSPAGRGCAIDTGTIIRDFTSADDGLRGWVEVSGDASAIGRPFIGRDGRVMAFSTVTEDGTVAFLPGNVVARIAGTMARGGNEPAAPFGLIVDQPGPVMARRLRAGRQRGAAVMLVADRSPAARAGIVAGDIILTAAGSPIAAPSEIERALSLATGPVELTIQRRGQMLTLTLKQ